MRSRGVLRRTPARSTRRHREVRPGWPAYNPVRPPQHDRRTALLNEARSPQMSQARLERRCRGDNKEVADPGANSAPAAPQNQSRCHAPACNAEGGAPSASAIARGHQKPAGGEQRSLRRSLVASAGVGGPADLFALLCRRNPGSRHRWSFFTRQVANGPGRDVARPRLTAGAAKVRRRKSRAGGGVTNQPGWDHRAGARRATVTRCPTECAAPGVLSVSRWSAAPSR